MKNNITILNNEPDAVDALREFLGLNKGIYGDKINTFVDGTKYKHNCSYYDSEVIAEVCAFSDIKRTLGDVLIDSVSVDKSPVICVYGDVSKDNIYTYKSVEEIIKSYGGELIYIFRDESGDATVVNDSDNLAQWLNVWGDA